MALRCINCGIILCGEDFVWQVRRITGMGESVYSPTCSQKCAKEAQEKNAAMHRSRMYDVENQSFQKMKASIFEKT